MNLRTAFAALTFLLLSACPHVHRPPRPPGLPGPHVPFVPLPPGAPRPPMP